MGNQLPRAIENQGVWFNEILTNTEGLSYWHNRGTGELYNTEGIETGLFFHVVTQQLPGFSQGMNALSFPFTFTADAIAQAYLREFKARLIDIGQSDKANNAIVEVRDDQDMITNLAPMSTEKMTPASHLYVIVRVGGSEPIGEKKAIAMLIYKYLGYRTPKQAFSDLVEADAKESLVSPSVSD